MKNIKKMMAYVLICTMVIAGTGISQTEISNATLSGLDIAVYADGGADARSVASLCMAFERMGHNPVAIAAGDLVHDRLTTSNFDILVIPAGDPSTSGGYTEYDDTIGGREAKIRSFVNAGGGVIAIEYGAAYMCDSYFPRYSSVDPAAVDLYAGDCYALYSAADGMGQIGIANSSFGTVGTRYTTVMTNNTPYFDVETGATVIAEYRNMEEDGEAAIIGFRYNSGGYVCLVGPRLEFDVTSEDDLSAWDNLRYNFYDTESELPLLAKLVEYAYCGSVLNQTNIASVSTTGKRVAVYSERTFRGGAWPGYLPAVFKAVMNAGHTPVAIDSGTIKNGYLTTDNFDAVIFPGGYSYGYWVQLPNYHTQIQDFVSDGGGALGICAGSFYLSDYVKWQGSQYDYPVDIFNGTAEGDLADIAAWPSRAMTPVTVYDSTLGLNDDYSVTYYGGPCFKYGTKTTVGTYEYGGTYDGQPAFIRGTYGSGRYFLCGPHPETEEGDTNDWCWWDNYEYNSPTAQTDPDSEWDILDAALDWITAAGSASEPTTSYITYPLYRRSIYDNTFDAVTDIQVDDEGSFNGELRCGDGVYSVDPIYGDSGSTMCVYGFGKGLSGTPSSVTLKVKYKFYNRGNPTQYIRWSTDGSTWHNTTIKPTQIFSYVTETFDLKAAGVDTINELQNLYIYYSNDYQSDSGTVVFDYIHVDVNY